MCMRRNRTRNLALAEALPVLVAAGDQDQRGQQAEHGLCEPHDEEHNAGREDRPQDAAPTVPASPEGRCRSQDDLAGRRGEHNRCDLGGTAEHANRQRMLAEP